jgi:integrase
MTPEMGRPKTVYLDLPPRMGARTLKSGRIRYYYTGFPGKKIPLGSDLNEARLKWARLENGEDDSAKFVSVSERWEKKELEKLAFRTQKAYAEYLVNLREAFKAFTLDEIQAVDVRQYLDRRTAKVAGNREVSLLSVIFNWARERGLTNSPNPCLGVKRNKERPRGRYVTDEEYDAAMAKAPPFLQDTMDLALLTGQRVSDVLKMTRQDMRDGVLWVVQDKTGAKMGVRIEGKLKSVLERVLARPHAVASVFSIIADDARAAVSYWAINYAFTKIKVDWQFRDLRAKAATDSPDIKAAQGLLGHATEATTAKVYRRVKGNVVAPLR